MAVLSVEKMKELIELRERIMDDSKPVQDCMEECPNCGHVGYLIILFHEPNLYELPAGSVICYNCDPKKKEKKMDWDERKKR